MPQPWRFPLLVGLLAGSSFAVSRVSAQEPLMAQRSLQTTEAQVAEWLESHRDHPPVLRAFVQRMPKGGDIHSHLNGAVYAEHYLEWAAADGFCVDPEENILIEPSACGQDSTYFPAADLLNRSAVYDDLVNRWSTRNLPFAGQSGHDQFFEAFAGFSPIADSVSRWDDMVAEVANRAASQNISYLELMFTFQGSAVRQLGREVGWNGDFAATRLQLLDRGLLDLVEKGRQELAALDQEVATTLRCGTASAQPGCEVTVRYLQQTTRNRAPEMVFAQLNYAFELAQADSRMVGINLVAPEDHPIALRDYTLQMEMVQFLSRQFPDVKVALHAGELSLGLVPPDDLRFHIRQAVEIAGAERIGHGVDVLYEDNPFDLMEEMRQRGVLVEICLTSNEVILNVQGEEHPFQQYWLAGVPVALASDDEGIARIDLSHEYLLAAQRYDLGYSDLKKIARNSLEYSFLEGESLWQSPDFAAMVSVCAEDSPRAAELSEGCTAFLAENDRARTQWQLETEFAEFEALSWFR